MNQAPKIRLYVTDLFAAGYNIILEQAPSHYLAHVMRAKEGDAVAVFNGQEGEWLASVASISKKAVTLQLQHILSKHKASPDLWLAFAPIKNKVDVVVEKAVELGVSKLLPVYTRHAVVKSVNMDKVTSYAVEAAEQCGRHDVPAIEEVKDIPTLLGNWPKDRILLFADESGKGADLKTLLPSLPAGKYGILVGPEGGFSDDERKALAIASQVKAFCMGPRILRADTASIAALACVQAWLGDWEERPNFVAHFETTGT